MRCFLLAVGLVLTIAVAPARAALTPLTNASELPAGLSLTESFATLPAGALPSLTALAGTTGEVEIDAASGLFGNGAGVLSTTLDEDTITLTFTQPVIGFAVTGGVVGESFDYLDGTWTLTVGADSEDFAGAATAASFAGVLSDTPFTAATIGIAGFDTDASSVAFVGLEGVTSVVPLPAAAPMLATGLAAIAALRLRRRH